jgi:hypothetical protein
MIISVNVIEQLSKPTTRRHDRRRKPVAADDAVPMV